MLQSLYLEPFWLWPDEIGNCRELFLQPKLLIFFGVELLQSMLSMPPMSSGQSQKGSKYSDYNMFKFEPSCTWNKLCATFQMRQIHRGLVHGYFLLTATLSYIYMNKMSEKLWQYKASINDQTSAHLFVHIWSIWAFTSEHRRSWHQPPALSILIWSIRSFSAMRVVLAWVLAEKQLV